MTALETDGRARAVVEAVAPQVDGGRFPVKRSVGELLVVEADCFADGHDIVLAQLLWRPESARAWSELPMAPLFNDRWRGELRLESVGAYRYTVRAWVDAFASWRRDLARREDPEDLRVAAQLGAMVIAEAAQRAAGQDRARLEAWASALRDAAPDGRDLRALGLDAELGALAQRYVEPRFAVTHRASSRSSSTASARASAPGTSCSRARRARRPAGTARSAMPSRACPHIADMGFDVLYLPPIHPIGRAHRKGPNNALEAEPGRSGQPVGDRRGRRRAHGGPPGRSARSQDFDRLVGGGRARGIEIALDIALPVLARPPVGAASTRSGSATAPTARSSTPRTRRRSTRTSTRSTSSARTGGRCGSELAERRALLDRAGRAHLPRRQPAHEAVPLLGVADRRGEARRIPTSIFLAEAFTRPKVMYRLAKLGFTPVVHLLHLAQHQARARREYFTELTAAARDASIFRPNLWPNTPDILHEYLQHGGRAGVRASRLVLAATLAASYGIYGPAFELLEHEPREAGSEEYLDSEKYEVRHWDLDRPDSLRDADRAGQPDPPREPGAAAERQPALPRRRQRAAHRLQQARRDDARRT